MSEIPWGEPVDEPEPGGAQAPYLAALAQACAAHPSFAFVGWRRVFFRDGSNADYIVMDARDGGWAPTPEGFHRVERLALGFLPRWRVPFDVRALRADFPDALHVNAVAAGEPKSLCLYAEPWATIRRIWTAYSHLERILWWLRKTADGTLHAPDQPLEPVFYGSRYFLILPRCAQEPLTDASPPLSLKVLPGFDVSGAVIRGEYGSSATTPEGTLDLDIVDVRLPAASADVIRYFPPHLTALHDNLVAIGSELLTPLREAIAAQVTDEGLKRKTAARMGTLVVLHVPRLREGKADSTDVLGFVTEGDLASLGEACGALVASPDNQRLYADFNLLPANPDTQAVVMAACAHISVSPVSVSFELDAKSARSYSGIEETVGEFRGLLIGVGALGSLLAELWARCGWGHWDYVDGDILLPHNTVRHLGKSVQLGFPKAEVVARLAGFLGTTDRTRGRAFVEWFNDPTSALTEVVGQAKLLVDASTTLHVARDAMDNDTMPRMASVFLTPNGRSSVLLLDSADRGLRVAHIEAQYYHAILHCEWGAHHLEGHAGTGIDAGGCRRASSTLAYDLIHIHAGTLSRQLRRHVGGPEARLLVWTLEQPNGALHPQAIPVEPISTANAGEWRVVWDAGLEASMRAQRTARLPRETGGILLGYLDQVLKVMFVVDALPAPKDSKADRGGFTRGKLGVRESIEEAHRRTTGIVDYIGEWHSHPEGHSAIPSDLDVVLLAELAALRAREQLPTLMLIVGEGPMSVSFAHSPEPRA